MKKSLLTIFFIFRRALFKIYGLSINCEADKRFFLLLSIFDFFENVL